MDDIKKAVQYLNEGGYTCVLYGNGEFYSSCHRGVKPLIDFIKTGKNFSGFSAADKIIGKGAAFLYVILGVKCVWAKTLSEKAKAVLDAYKIENSYEILVPDIKNRAGTGLCPIEQAVSDVDSPREALSIIQKTLETIAAISRQSL